MALRRSDHLRLAEVVLLYGMFSWTLFSLSVAVIAEWGAEFRRRLGSASDSDAGSRAFYRNGSHSRLLILVPSYREEPDTIWQTLMSAALAEHTQRDVVLLIDDPDAPSTADHERLLRLARAMPHELQKIFNAAAAPFQAELQSFSARRDSGIDVVAERSRLAILYVRAAEWFEAQANQFRGTRGHAVTHTDRLFITKILVEPAVHHRFHAERLAERVATVEDIAAEYLRLASLFTVSFASFERKRFTNLSHAPNKAMNLNAYLGLIGGTFRERKVARGVRLDACDPTQATLVVPQYEFVVAIDADSLITSDYAVRLIEFMTRPENARVAIAQSPYTAVPNPPTQIERAASASTDAQYFSHQGLASLDASSWVGASALMRYEALLDIATQRVERGYPITVFIKDEILIEDAAATVDLLRKDWTIYHDHRRLSYSATPPDYGSLIIQRRRWANGGLLILPRLLSYALRSPWSTRRLKDAVIRTPNLTSAASSGFFFSIFLLLPVEDDIVPPWMAAIAFPSLLLTGYGLVRAGYRWTDLFLVQALNVLLAPINLAGTIQSLRQAVTGRQIPFARTPKMVGRTRAPKSYVFWIYGLILYATAAAIVDLRFGRSSHAAFALFNASILLFCVMNFIGIRNSLDDLGLPLPGGRGDPLLRHLQAVEIFADQATGGNHLHESGQRG
jgi:cellulose synthase/poly-beta-1,6-N-acetylglucosamine synthase-like glycosyltransferase